VQLYSLETAIYSLLKNEPFYAHFTLMSKIIYDTKEETAYATIKDNTSVLGFNPDFLKKIGQDNIVKVLKHEILHQMFKHVYKKHYNINNKAEMHNWNIAMDCCINQYIRGIETLGPNIVNLENFKKAIKNDNVLPFQTAQYYYDLIEQATDSCKQKVAGMETLDNHDKNSEGDSETSEAQEQLEKAIMSKIAEEALKASNGNVPSDLIKVIDALRPEAQHNWKQILRNFVANAVSKKTIGTRRKSNRRFGFDVPGKKKERQLKLGVCIDTSGSISDSQFEIFMSEIVDISKNVSEAHLIYADCIVQKVVKIDSKNKIPMERFGAGGTAYQSAIDKAIELNCDAICYFGDMDTSDTPTDPKKPFLWVITGQQNPPVNWGKSLRLS
jgi:predicted metal-dependent peptidase